MQTYFRRIKQFLCKHKKTIIRKNRNDASRRIEVITVCKYCDKFLSAKSYKITRRCYSKSSKCMICENSDICW